MPQKHATNAQHFLFLGQCNVGTHLPKAVLAPGATSLRKGKHLSVPSPASCREARITIQSRCQGSAPGCTVRLPSGRCRPACSIILMPSGHQPCTYCFTLLAIGDKCEACKQDIHCCQSLMCYVTTSCLLRCSPHTSGLNGDTSLLDVL